MNTKNKGNIFNLIVQNPVKHSRAAAGIQGLACEFAPLQFTA